MAQKPETLFKNRVRKDLEKLPKTWFEKIQQVSICGTPDFLCCINGNFVAIELKKDEKEDADDLQKYKLYKIAKAGGKTFVANPSNWDTIYKYLQELAEIDKEKHHAF